MEKATSGYFPPDYVTLKMLHERRLREKQQRQEEEEEEEERQRAASASASAEGRSLSISRASRKPQDPRPPSIPYPASNHTEVIRQPPDPFRSKNPMSDAPQIPGASPDSLPKGMKKRKKPRRKVKKLKSVDKEEEKKLAEDDTLAEDSYWKDPNRWQERGKYWPVDPRDVFRPQEPNKEKEIVDKIAELKVSESNQTPIGGREVGVREGRPVDGVNSGSRGYGGFSSRGRLVDGSNSGSRSYGGSSSRGRPVDGSNSGSRSYGGFSSRGRPAGAAMVWVKKTTSS